MEASITLDFSSYSNNIIEVIKLFGKIGWGIYNTKGEVEYLPIGDADKYNWQWGKMSEAEFFEMVSNKIAHNEQVGVNLFYSNGAEGISLLAHNTKQILLSIMINRRFVDKCHTDMVWYLEHIVYRFFKIGVRLLSYELKEYED